VTLLASNDLHQFMVQMLEFLFYRFNDGICARLVTCFELFHIKSRLHLFVLCPTDQRKAPRRNSAGASRPDLLVDPVSGQDVGCYGMPTRLVGPHDGASVVMAILLGVMVLGLHKTHPGMMEMRQRSYRHSALHPLNALISLIDRGPRFSKVHRAFKCLCLSGNLQKQSPEGRSQCLFPPHSELH
jgi:hypothetical protein